MLKVKIMCMAGLLQAGLVFGQNANMSFGNPVALTPAETGYLQPVWSPDNRKIAVSGVDSKEPRPQTNPADVGTICTSNGILRHESFHASGKG